MALGERGGQLADCRRRPELVPEACTGPGDASWYRLARRKQHELLERSSGKHARRLLPVDGFDAREQSLLAELARDRQRVVEHLGPRAAKAVAEIRDDVAE